MQIFRVIGAAVTESAPPPAAVFPAGLCEVIITNVRLAVFRVIRIENALQNTHSACLARVYPLQFDVCGSNESIAALVTLGPATASQLPRRNERPYADVNSSVPSCFPDAAQLAAALPVLGCARPESPSLAVPP